MITHPYPALLLRSMAGAASVVSIGLLVGSGRGWITGNYGPAFSASTAVVVCIVFYLLIRRDAWQWRFVLVLLGIVTLGLLFPGL